MVERLNRGPDLRLLFAQQLGSALRQRERERQSDDSRIGLLDWGREFLPRHFYRPPSGLQTWLAGELDRWGTFRESHGRGMKLNVVGPRGAAKSTLGSLAFPLRAAVEGREAYIWITSDTRHQAVMHLENIKAELDDNPRLGAAYAEATGRGAVWRAPAIRHSRRSMSCPLLSTE